MKSINLRNATDYKFSHLKIQHMISSNLGALYDTASWKSFHISSPVKYKIVENYNKRKTTSTAMMEIHMHNDQY